jgi:hypothetical protein
MRGLRYSRLAGRTGRGVNTVFIQQVKKHIAFAPGDSEMKIAREPMIERASGDALGCDIQ